MQVLEGGHPAEGMTEGGARGEVAIDSIMLLLGSALGERLDDGSDLVGCSGLVSPSATYQRKLEDVLTWILHGVCPVVLWQVVVFFLLLEKEVYQNTAKPCWCLPGMF